MKQTMHCVSSRSDMGIEMFKGFIAILCILEADLDVDFQASLIIESKETISISHHLEVFFVLLNLIDFPQCNCSVHSAVSCYGAGSWLCCNVVTNCRSPG